MSKRTKHIMELIPELIRINNKIVAIKISIAEQSGIKYTSQDARMVALDSIQNSILAVEMWIQCFNSLANAFTKDKSFNESGFLSAVGSELNAIQTETTMLNHLRLGFLTLTHFKIDNLFSNLLKHEKVLPKNTGYWNLTNAILDKCSISVNGNEKDILMAFAHLRNSLHGNGIHRNSDLTIMIGDFEFKFIKNSRVECASWDHIVTLLDANIDVLEKILLSKEVVDIKTDIKDDFASGL